MLYAYHYQWISSVDHGILFPVYVSASKMCMRLVQKVLNFCARLMSGRQKYDYSRVSTTLVNSDFLPNRIACVIEAHAF